MKKIQKKTLYAITFFLITLAVLSANFFLNFSSFYLGYYFGFFFFLFLSCLAIYEVAKNFFIKNKKTKTATLIFFMVLLYVLPFSQTPFNLKYNDQIYKITFYFEPVQIHNFIKYNIQQSIFLSWLFNFSGSQFLGFFIKIIFIFFVLFFVVCFQGEKEEKKNFFLIFTSFFLISVFFKAIYIVSVANFYLVLFLLSIAFLVDTFGQIFGIFLGNKIFNYKLTKISPSKTIEGTLFSFVLGFFYTFTFLLLSRKYFTQISLNYDDFFILFFSFFSVFFVIIGDLFYSLIKRILQIKDFSNLIPEHGGINDRLDSSQFLILFFVFTMLT